MTFGERVLLRRRRRGLTQQELVTQTGLNKNTIARIEQGNMKDLGGQTVAKLAQVLQVRTDFLLGLEELDVADAEDLAAAVA